MITDGVILADMVSAWLRNLADKIDAGDAIPGFATCTGIPSDTDNVVDAEMTLEFRLKVPDATT